MRLEETAEVRVCGIQGGPVPCSLEDELQWLRWEGRERPGHSVDPRGAAPGEGERSPACRVRGGLGAQPAGAGPFCWARMGAGHPERLYPGQGHLEYVSFLLSPDMRAHALTEEKGDAESEPKCLQRFWSVLGHSIKQLCLVFPLVGYEGSIPSLMSSTLHRLIVLPSVNPQCVSRGNPVAAWWSL